MKKSSKEEKALVRCRPKFAQRLRKWITKGNPESTERGLESGIQSVPFKIHDWLELPQMDDGSDRSMGGTRKIRICTPLLSNPTPTRSTRCLNQRQGRQSPGTLIVEAGQNLFSIVHICGLSDEIVNRYRHHERGKVRTKCESIRRKRNASLFFGWFSKVH